jgi:LPXTG-motif cell wall-anchored protein
VNGKKVAYYPALYKNNILTAIKLAPGSYTVKAAFNGLRWANWVSLLAWLGILFAAIAAFFLKKKRKAKR